MRKFPFLSLVVEQGIATYDELADLVFKATNNNDVLGTTAKLRVSLDIDGNINGSYNYLKYIQVGNIYFQF